MVLIVATLSILTGAAVGAASVSPVADTPFIQEYRTFHPVEGDGAAEANDVRAIAVDGAGRVWTATKAGVYRFADGAWQAMLTGDDAGPAFAAEADAAGQVWLGVWNGLYRSTEDGALAKIDGVDQAIGAIGFTSDCVVAMGPFGLWHNREGLWEHSKGAWADTPRAIVCDVDSTLWVPTGHGLYHIDLDEGTFGHLHDEDEILVGDLYDAVMASDGKLWVGGFSGLDVFDAGTSVMRITPAEGLPHPDVRSLAFHPDGTLWVGTACGVARYNAQGNPPWTLRHSLRWVPSDDVRDVAFDADGTAWVATGKGVSAIQRRMMTLEEKAGYFHDIVMDRKIREPGLVEKSRLLTPGDLSTWRTEDDDNDGSYTCMYMVMEAFRYQVTKDPKARENAMKAFNVIEMLQTITNTDGFMARTIIPAWWIDGPSPEGNENPHRVHDRNRTYTPEEIADRLVRDPRYKPVEVRWRKSDDGKWYWKGDTSSDEIVGHFWGFLHYYNLVAETEEEKDRVRNLARRVMDYIIDGGFTLRDTDGEHTRWGVWAPEILLGDEDWQAEMPLNCAEILSFLKVTYYMTGDERYEKYYRTFAEEHGYADVARAPKPTAPSERTHIDSDLLTMTVPGLFLETNPELRAKYLEGLHEWFGQIENEYCPMYSFVCAIHGVDNVGVEQCAAFLRDAPLDNIRWTVDNTKREDIALVRSPEIDPLQTDRLPPPSERGIMRWDKNPWCAISGDGGNTEGSTIYWLLPYWMGRYYGLIAAPE